MTALGSDDNASGALVIAILRIGGVNMHERGAASETTPQFLNPCRPIQNAISCKYHHNTMIARATQLE